MRMQQIADKSGKRNKIYINIIPSQTASTAVKLGSVLPFVFHVLSAVLACKREQFAEHYGLQPWTMCQTNVHQRAKFGKKLKLKINTAT